MFDRLFGADAHQTPEERACKNGCRQSIVDFVPEDTKKLQANPGPTDKRKLEEYLASVHAIERPIARAESENAQWIRASASPTACLLDNSMIVYGAGLSDGNCHTHHDLPPLCETKTGTSMSLREQMEQYRINAPCATCHTSIDPLGIGLEHFDSIGRWRSQYE